MVPREQIETRKGAGMVWQGKTISRNDSRLGEKNPVLQAPLICKHGITETTCHLCLGGRQSSGIKSGPPKWFFTNRKLGFALTRYRHHLDDVNDK